MTAYDLDRFCILLVDDNKFVRDILREVLRLLSVGEVITAESGVDAIEILSTKNGTYGQRIDLVISDLVMAPIDGLLLLKWIRQGKESPNRFMPFIMMSGAADADSVEKVRDAGANEFLAKPFSAASVSERILQVIDRPRQFVATRDYFGCDRRRKRDLMLAEDQRVLGEKQATIVYSTGKIIRPKSSDDVYLFRLPNSMKEKAGGLGAREPGMLPVKHLKEADARLERKSIEFQDWALGYLATLSRLCERALTQPENQRSKHFKNINLLAHELRGQGGIFGYPIITNVGEMLYKTTISPCPTEDRAVRIIKAHIDTMRTVFREQITGDGGKVGVALLEELKRSIIKYMKEDAFDEDADKGLSQPGTADASNVPPVLSADRL